MTAARWATYPGDCRGNLGRIVGPTLDDREVLHIVTEDYDPATGKTRVGFAFGMTPDTSPRSDASRRSEGRNTTGALR